MTMSNPAKVYLLVKRHDSEFPEDCYEEILSATTDYNVAAAEADRMNEFIKAVNRLQTDLEKFCDEFHRKNPYPGCLDPDKAREWNQRFRDTQRFFVRARLGLADDALVELAIKYDRFSPPYFAVKSVPVLTPTSWRTSNMDQVEIA